MRPIEVLRKANDRGEVGYAYGGAETDYHAIHECLELSLIVFRCDASVGGRGDPLGRPYQRRDIYALTAKGRELLAKEKGPL